MDEYRQAISFTNSYFALVDGLASGLENHLAEDVVLDWFGRTVRGRKNVTAFIKAHKVNSRHMFSNIIPRASIGYKKKNLNRKKIFSQDSRVSQDRCTDNDKSLFRETKACRFRKDVETGNHSEIDSMGSSVMDDMTYDLNEGDLCNLFKLEITSTNIDEIEQSINRIKLEEEMAPTIKAVKRECGQGDGPLLLETSTIKYVEAVGEIEFSRKFLKRDTWDPYLTTTSSIHTWRRSCKLQIAYSVMAEHRAPEVPVKSANSTGRYAQPKTRLPSLEEISEITNRLIPNTQEFSGFLKSDDFFDDRNEFLDCLETEMASKDPCATLLSPQYIRNKLVFNESRLNLLDREKQEGNKRRFVFNYQIHLIIYEGSNRCRINLLREFEKMKG